jgi:thiamine-monophosphate kinase
VIDLSDGLLQDLAHLARSSGVQARLVSKCVPVNRVATLQDALGGGDDYELLCASPVDLPGFTRVGSIAAGSGIYLDDHSVAAAGFDHFHA